MRTPLRPEPRTVVLAGDWHECAADAVRVITKSAECGAEWVIQLGDFGFWSYPTSPYLDAIEIACMATGVRVAWIDGNHERYTLLTGKGGILDQPDAQHHAHRVRQHVYYLPRGYRWTWHGKTWLALGGATSLDRNMRTEWISWFKEEEITEQQADYAIGGGPVDVLICHDGPASTNPKFPPIAWPRSELIRAQHHRNRLQRVMDGVKPQLVAHGHFHLSYVERVQRDWGAALVIGLDHAGSRGTHMILLDTETLTWQVPQ